jgi:hypothetical protein
LYNPNDSERFTISDDGSYHSLKSIANNSFGKGESRFRAYDSLSIQCNSEKSGVLIKFNRDEVTTPVLQLGNGYPYTITFEEKFGINAKDIYVKALSGEAEVQIFGNGNYTI